jgi:hypothetical protein
MSNFRHGVLADDLCGQCFLKHDTEQRTDTVEPIPTADLVGANWVARLGVNAGAHLEASTPYRGVPLGRSNLDPELTCVDVEADLQVGLGGPEGPPLRIRDTSELRNRRRASRSRSSRELCAANHMEGETKDRVLDGPLTHSRA